MTTDAPATLNLADMDDEFETVQVSDDETPPASSVPTCDVCGKVLPYGGRGRKPTKCEEHKRRTASTLGSTTRKSSGSVAQAVTTLDMLYSMVSLGLMMSGAYKARDALEASLPGLRESNAKYLAQDAELVKRINAVGKVSGRAGFIGAQVMTLGPVAFLAYAELTEKRASAAPGPKRARPETAADTPGDIPAMFGGIPVG